MGKTTAAKKYVGIDCHDATLVFEVMDEKGQVELRGTVPTRAETIRNVLEGLKAPLEVAFEEGTLAQWLHDVLKPLGHRIVVCDPRKNKRKGQKSDRIDTHELANRLRMRDLSPVYHEVGQLRVLKEYAAMYRGLVQDSTRVMQRTKSVYRSRAIRCKGDAVYSAETRGEWFKQLEPAPRLRAELLGEELDHLRPLRQKAKKAMVDEARKQAAYGLICSVPMFGPVRTAQLMATVITPFRFRTKRQFWAYAGLAVVTHSSADREVIDGKLVRRSRPPMTRGLNRNHNSHLKAILMAAAQDGARREGVWKSFFEARLKEMNGEMALLAVARKIAAVVLSLWKRGVAFDPRLIAPTT